MDLCSVCLQQSTNLVAFTSITNDSLSISQKLSECVPEVDWRDDFLLCSPCTTSLDQAYEFKQKCLNLEKSRALIFNELQKFSIKTKFVKLDGEILTSKLKNQDSSVGIFESDEEKQEGNLLEVGNNCEISQLEDENFHLVVTESDEEVQEDNHLEVENDCESAESNTVEEKIHHMCAFCGKSFATRSSCRRHEATHTEIEEQPSENDAFSVMKCEFCEKTFKTSRWLYTHYRRDHNQDPSDLKPYKCHMCDKKFNRHSFLNVHIRSHLNIRCFACSMCDKKFITSWAVKRHERLHSKSKGKQIQCDICDRLFITKNHLDSHKLSAHSDPSDWKFTCEFCSKKFLSNENYESHLLLHKIESELKCNICDKSFVDKYDLGKHILTHTGEIEGPPSRKLCKRFECHYCGAIYVGKPQFTHHLHSHTGLRPFSCELCNKAFTCLKYLKAHVYKMHKLKST